MSSDALVKAVELAPLCKTAKEVGQRVNEALGLTYTEAAWRGMLNRDPSTKERIRKALNTTVHRTLRTIYIDGDVKGAVTNDVHVPVHDPAAVALACKVLRKWKPDVHVMAGDSLDFQNLSRYDKDPSVGVGVQNEINQWHIEVVAPMLAATGKKCDTYYLPGNHELRLQKYLWRNPELYGIRGIELPTLLDLDHYGIKYAEEAVHFGDILEVSHGTRVARQSGASARAEQEVRRYGISTITGHVHRAGRFQTATRHGQSIGQESPCLCTLDPDWMRHADWVQGLTLFQIKDGELYIEAIQFSRNYRCFVHGEMVSL